MLKKALIKEKIMAENFYDNRELSWLKFNARVLEEAFDETTPLFERLRFVGIFCSNLDEFFMIRVGSWYDKFLYDPKDRENKTNMNAKEQLAAIAKSVSGLIPIKDEAYSQIMNGLAKYGVEHISEDMLSPQEDAYLKAFFSREVRPLLFTGLVDKKHPIPFLKSGEVYIGCKIRKKTETGGKFTFGILPVPENLPKVVFLPKSRRFLLIEEVIRRYAKSVFSNFDIHSRCIFRVTRNANMPLSLGFMPVLEKYLEKQSELFFKPLTPQLSPAILRNVSLIDQIKHKDILLSYPYENINQFIRLLDEAAENPDVSSIKITLYRVARDSKIINALNKAAENGKDVLALVELRARFDEENNIGWSKQLEDAGVQVIYGLEELKVHSKLLLITLRSGNDVTYITQVGTGNYNERTSKLYTDLTLLTADKAIGADASVVFNALCEETTVESTNRLLVAPKGLKSRIVEFIDNEITYGKDGYIGIKINSLTDRDLIEKLAEASRAGVKVELVVRGICCLIPGVPGQTENIRVISIVGRFLEHSRIYIFGKENRRRVYISSADFMTRNTERRVEVAAPVLDRTLADKVCHIFNICMSDNVKARELKPNGLYERVSAEGSEPLNAQAYFYNQAYEQAQTSDEAALQNEIPVKVKIKRIK